MATLDQSRASLDPDRPLKDALTGGGSDLVEINGERTHVIGYMKEFLFGPEQARTPIGDFRAANAAGSCSRGRLAQPSNLLVLDEPTNDFDLETLDLLQDMLGDYTGHADRLSATTAIFSTASRHPCWSAKAAAAGSNMPVAIPTWSPSAAPGWAVCPSQRHSPLQVHPPPSR